MTADSTHTFFEAVLSFLSSYVTIETYILLSVGIAMYVYQPRVHKYAWLTSNQFLSLYSNSTTYAHLPVVYPLKAHPHLVALPFIGPYPSGPPPWCPSPSGLPPSGLHWLWPPCPWAVCPQVTVTSDQWAQFLLSYLLTQLTWSPEGSMIRYNNYTCTSSRGRTVS